MLDNLYQKDSMVFIEPIKSMYINNYELQAYREGEFYLLNLVDANNIMQNGLAKNVFNAEDCKYYKLYKGQELTKEDNIIFDRVGGYGDLIILASIANYLRAKYGCKIDLCCGERFINVAMRNLGFDNAIIAPLKLSQIKNYSYIGKFFGFIEGNEIDTETSMHEHYCNALGIDFKDYQEYANINGYTYYKTLPSDEIGGLNIFNSFTGWEARVGNIAIQLEASSPQRKVPYNTLFSVASTLAEKGYNVWMISEQPLQSLNQKRVFNIHGLEFHTLVGFLSKMDLLIGSDSVFPHLADAIDKPCMAIYGAFPSETRMGFYNPDLIMGIESGLKNTCKYCLRHHARNCHKLVSNAFGEFPECLFDINPQVLVHIAETILIKNNVHNCFIGSVKITNDNILKKKVS